MPPDAGSSAHLVFGPPCGRRKAACGHALIGPDSNVYEVNMLSTKNDLPEAIHAKSIEILNDRLADCIDLGTQAKQAHWNVPSFIALHELFDKVAEARRLADRR